MIAWGTARGFAALLLTLVAVTVVGLTAPTASVATTSNGVVAHAYDRGGAFVQVRSAVASRAVLFADARSNAAFRPFVISRTDFRAAEEGGSQLASGWRGTNMSDEDSFNYHYGKHGAGKTPQQYAQDARDWAANPTGAGTPVRLTDGTTGVRYRTPGGGPGILDSHGNIVTFWYR
jgi:hypothetical protein